MRRLGFSRNEETVSQLAAEYFLGAGVTAKGTIETELDVYLDCVFDGTIKSQGLVEIDTNGQFHGTLSARALRLSGSLEGTAQIAEQLTIHGSATLKGEAVASVLDLAQGAIVDARIQSIPRESRHE